MLLSCSDKGASNNNFCYYTVMSSKNSCIFLLHLFLFRNSLWDSCLYQVINVGLWITGFLEISLNKLKGLIYHPLHFPSSCLHCFTYGKEDTSTASVGLYHSKGYWVGPARHSCAGTTTYQLVSSRPLLWLMEEIYKSYSSLCQNKRNHHHANNTGDNK